MNKEQTKYYNNLQQHKAGFSEATIALEAKGGSRVAFSAARSSGTITDTLSYDWRADVGAVVISPTEAETEILLPDVTENTLISVTLTVINHYGNSAQRSYPVLVSPGANRGYDQEDPATFPQWSAAIPYPAGSQVSHKGGNYQAKWWVLAGVEPGLVTTTGPAAGSSLPWMQI